MNCPTSYIKKLCLVIFFTTLFVFLYLFVNPKKVNAGCCDGLPAQCQSGVATFCWYEEVCTRNGQPCKPGSAGCVCHKECVRKTTERCYLLCNPSNCRLSCAHSLYSTPTYVSDNCSPGISPKPACSCSWVNQGCNEGCWNGAGRSEVYQCNYSDCPGNGQTQCVLDSACFHCHSWVAQGCSANGCPSGQQSYKRVCHEGYDRYEYECRVDSSCCVCGGWTNQGCGPAGGCALNRMYQTRSCNPGGCSSTTNCAVDAACASSCTISLTPNPMTAFYGQNSILTATVNPVHATVSRVDFSSVDSNIASVSPASDSDDPYRTYVSGVQMGTTTITATAVLSPEGSCTTTVPVTVESAAWFQTQGGDIHVQGSLTDKIPATATDLNLSLDLDNYPGVVSQKDGIDLGDGFSSKSTAGNWVASSEYKGKPYSTFDFFKKKYAMNMTTDNFNGSLPVADGVYYSSGSETLNGDQGDWDLGGNRWLVILVEGDVNIPFNVVVGQGSFLAIASSGKITFGNNVRKAQGMFVANGKIDTGSSDRDFEGQGIFAANTFDLNRDFADARNRTTPAETFVARPDFLMSSYKNKDENLWWFFQKWQELAP